ncbi:MAG: carboxypeptidase M32 [Ktedonobacteraceae bacterium]|nr:carboxypeptidase M32 [Ktedonobacteraceae bacterium]
MLVTEQNDINFTQSDQRINELLHALREIADLEALQALTDWDQQTGMPAGAGEVRSYQAATLQGLIHERWTSPRLGKLLTELESVIEQSPFTNADRGLVRQARRVYDRSTKLPRQLVEEMERARVISHEAWVQARAHNDFASFAPHLERLIGYQREVADHIGYRENRYDALLDLYEPGLTTREVERLFAPVRDISISLLKRIQASGKKINTSFLQGDFSEAQQKLLAEKLLKNIGYDLVRGQIAISAHPFTTSMGSPQDVRLTVRYSDYLPMSMMAALHEGGHALYEQGSASSLLRTPVAGGASMGMHESQSRLWENAIGRSEAFWRGQYHLVQEVFPQSFQQVSVTDFARALNHVEASLIRVEADEVTYNLHIIIRFELEQAMVNGKVAVEDLPRLWNEKYRTYLGVEPDSDANGVLQDVHWTSGFGYFPSYTLGNLYGAQIYSTLRRNFADFDQRLASGETAFILDWLRERIYTFGAIYQPAELLQHVTGEAANPQHFVQYVTEKFSKIYEL